MEDFIVVRIDKTIRVIFREDFLQDNEFYTQNTIIEVLTLLYGKRGKDFDVDFSVDILNRPKKEEENE